MLNCVQTIRGRTLPCPLTRPFLRARKRTRRNTPKREAY